MNSILTNKHFIFLWIFLQYQVNLYLTSISIALDISYLLVTTSQLAAVMLIDCSTTWISNSFSIEAVFVMVSTDVILVIFQYQAMSI